MPEAESTNPADKRSEQDLLDLLVERKLISSAQANLVRSDQEVTAMSPEEILLARNWISEQKLKEVAPWLFIKGSGQGDDSIKNVSGSYEENLRRYRALMAEILGESSE